MMVSVISASAREQLHAALDQLLDSLPAHVRDAEEAERALRSGLQRLGRQTLQQWSDDSAKADGAPACSCGQAMRHRGCPAVVLETTFGAVHFKRSRRYCDACGTNTYPLDGDLRFAGHGVSWPLARLACLYLAQTTFEATRCILSEEHGARLSKETLERLIQHAGRMVLAQDDQQRQAFFALSPPEQQAALAENEAAPALIVISVDGTMVHTEDDWSEVRVGRVISSDRDGETLAQKSFARFLPVDQVGQQLFLDASELGYQKAEQRVVIGDGAAWIWENAATQFPEAVQILDWYHLSEKVHATGGVVFRDEVIRQEWTEEIKRLLWKGEVREARLRLGRLLKAIRRGKRKAVRQLDVYLKNNAERIDYARHQAAGLPIGSGMMESHCKNLVGQRCKNSGMRNWRKPHCEEVLRMRAARLDRTFNHLWSNKLNKAA